jgi:RsiW-degrading membrane proteinase PrsW (M82 family)
LLCAIAILSICTSFVLTGIINSFFVGVLGEEVGARIEAPIVEELLKPLSLIILATMFSLANRKRLVRINWLRSMKVDYAIGYASGLIFGVLESGITYRTFSGLRAITPFFHAFNTGLVGIGIYYVLTGGKKGIAKLVPIYLLAVLLHSTWNGGSSAVQGVIGLSTMIIGLIVLPQLLMKLGRRPAPR